MVRGGRTYIDWISIGGNPGGKLEDLVGNAEVFDVVSTDVTLRDLPELTSILRLEQSECDVCRKPSMPT